MCKTRFVEEYHMQRPYMKKAQCEFVYNSFCELVAAALAKGSPVLLEGVGTLRPVKGAPRRGYNPKTKTAIDIPSKTRVRFDVSKTLNQQLNVQ